MTDDSNSFHRRGSASRPFRWLPVLLMLCVLCLMGPINSARGQDIEWQEINKGLWGGGVKKIVAHPDGLLYALTFLGNGPEERIYRSADEGLSWEALDTGATDIGIATLIVFPDGELLASTFHGGLLRSFDDGDSWESIAEEFRFTSLVLHQSGDLFGAEYAGTSLRRSWDRGETWAPVGLEVTSAWITDIDVTHSGAILVATTENGLFRSNDMGATWKYVGLIGIYLPFVYVAPDGSIFVPVSLQGYHDGPGSCLQRSVDDGKNWHRFECGYRDWASGDFNVSSVAISESGTIFIAEWSRIYASSDSGQTWRTSTDLGFDSVTDDSFVMHGGKVYAGTWHTGIIVSEDEGESWERSNHGIGAATVRRIRSHPGGALYAVAHGVDLFRSDDHGESWVPLHAGMQRGLQLTETLAIDEAGHIYVAFGSVFRSSNEGTTWQALPESCFGQRVAFAPDGTMYVVDFNQIMRFDEDVEECKQVTDDLDYIHEIAFANNGDLLVGTASGADYEGDGVFRSSDGGITWDAMPMAPFNKSIYEILVKPNGVVIAGPMRSGIYRSEDDGYSFEAVWQPPYVGYVRDFALGPSGEIYAATAGGIYRSTDDGKNWQDIGDGIPSSRFSSVDLDPDGYLYLGTIGAGAYRSTKPIVVSKEIEPFPTSTDTKRFAYPNPFQSTVSIGFSLERAEFVRLTIHDSMGREVAVLAGAVYPSGEHILTWSPDAEASGVYFYRLQYGQAIDSGSLVRTR